MKKKIDIILTKNSFNKEEKGSIIKVKRGYAFNYLIPNRIAEVATKSKIKHITMLETKKAKQEEENKIKIELIKKTLENIRKIAIYKKRGEGHLMFGSITEKDIITWLNKYTNLTIRKTQIQILENKIIGTGSINIHLNHQNIINISLYIIPTNI